MDATQASEVEGADAAIAVRVAEECNRDSGQEATGAEKKLRADLARGPREEETIQSDQALKGRQRLQGCRFYPVGANLEDGGWEGNCGGSFRC